VIRLAVLAAVTLAAGGAAGKSVTIAGELQPTAAGAFTYVGTWHASGAIADSGKLTAGTTLISTQGITAIDKLKGKRGSLVFKLPGSGTDLAHWRWSIVSGTGRYKGLHASGTAAIDQSDPNNVHEVLKGKVKSSR